MKTYVWVTFGFLGWGFYQMSGGADFVPEQPQVAEVVETAPDMVTRAQTTSLLSVSTSNVQTAPEAAPVEEIIELTVDVVPAPPLEPAVVEIAAPAIETPADIREVASSRVNMRMGPSTDYDVITTLNAGTKLEVLSVDAAGWANVSTDVGLEGWMAERLLTEPET